MVRLDWYPCCRLQPATRIDQSTGVLISPYPDQEGNKLRSVSGARAISTTSRHELSSCFFLQGKAQKEIHAILTETLACSVPGLAKELSTPLYLLPLVML